MSQESLKSLCECNILTKWLYTLRFLFLFILTSNILSYPFIQVLLKEIWFITIKFIKSIFRLNLFTSGIDIKAFDIVFVNTKFLRFVWYYYLIINSKYSILSLVIHFLIHKCLRSLDLKFFWNTFDVSS